MEYALKATVFLRPGRRAAEADWTSFAAAIHRSFTDAISIEVQEAKVLLLEKPPKKQINQDGEIDWCSSAPDAQNETDLLLKYVCRVRNNLFHGGKFNGRWFEPERSGPLIQASSQILQACREACPEVDAAYHG